MNEARSKRSFSSCDESKFAGDRLMRGVRGEQPEECGSRPIIEMQHCTDFWGYS